MFIDKGINSTLVPPQFIPIRFLFTNKLSKDDKLLLALDAFALAKSLGPEVSVGRIFYGDDHALKMKTIPCKALAIHPPRKRCSRASTFYQLSSHNSTSLPFPTA
jgi:hypothetical protein